MSVLLKGLLATIAVLVTLGAGVAQDLVLVGPEGVTLQRSFTITESRFDAALLVRTTKAVKAVFVITTGLVAKDGRRAALLATHSTAPIEAGQLIEIRLKSDPLGIAAYTAELAVHAELADGPPSGEGNTSPRGKSLVLNIGVERAGEPALTVDLPETILAESGHKFIFLGQINNDHAVPVSLPTFELLKVERRDGSAPATQRQPVEFNKVGGSCNAQLAPQSLCTFKVEVGSQPHGGAYEFTIGYRNAGRLEKKIVSVSFRESMWLFLLLVSIGAAISPFWSWARSGIDERLDLQAEVRDIQDALVPLLSSADSATASLLVDRAQALIVDLHHATETPANAPQRIAGARQKAKALMQLVRMREEIKTFEAKDRNAIATKISEAVDRLATEADGEDPQIAKDMLAIDGALVMARSMQPLRHATRASLALAVERAASAPEVDRQAFASERTALEEALDRNDPEATREALERLDALNAKHAPAAGGQGEAAAREANPQPAARPDFGTTQVLKPWLEPVLGAPAAVLRAAARRLRLVMLLVALLATLAMGLKTLWLSAPAWGGWNDYFAAIAFGLASQLGATFVLSEIAGKLTPRS